MSIFHNIYYANGVLGSEGIRSARQDPLSGSFSRTETGSLATSLTIPTTWQQRLFGLAYAR